MAITRFAPSPTGYLHLGHAYSALQAQRAAEDGLFLLRIEDIDPVRCRTEFTESIFEDLKWLGLVWPVPVRRQSQHLSDYTNALDRLKARGLVYPCFCSRREIEQEALAAPHAEDAIVLYPGTCRHLSPLQREERLAQQRAASWRLDIEAALDQTGPLHWHEEGKGLIVARPELFGDVVLARKDVPTSYHLSVTVDDAWQGITLVTRGEDLFASTHIHRLLQALLDYPTPSYRHHNLLCNEAGRRYAKRDQALTLRALRARGVSPEDILRQLA